MFGITRWDNLFCYPILKLSGLFVGAYPLWVGEGEGYTRVSFPKHAAHEGVLTFRKKDLGTKFRSRLNPAFFP